MWVWKIRGGELGKRESRGHGGYEEIYHSIGKGLAAPMHVDHMHVGFMGRHEFGILMEALEEF